MRYDPDDAKWQNSEGWLVSIQNGTTSYNSYWVAGDSNEDAIRNALDTSGIVDHGEIIAKRTGRLWGSLYDELRGKSRRYD